MDVCDLLVVGGGPAGIGTAYRLRDSALRVKVLELHNQVGGRTKSIPVVGGMANTGAQFVYRGTPSEDLVSELDLRTVRFEPKTYGIAVDGHTSVGTTNAAVVEGLPWGEDDRGALLHVLDDAVAEYRRSTKRGTFTRGADELAGETVADRLRLLPSRVRVVIETAVRGGAVGSTEHLTAQYALRYFASYLAHESENRLLVVDGMQALTIGMASRLAPGVVELSTSVTHVRFEAGEGGYVVAATGPHGDKTYWARQVVVAVPAPLVAGLVEELPPWKLAALREAKTPGSTTMIVAADVRGLEHYRDWAFVTTVGGRFDCIINSTPGRWRSEREPGVVHFMCYGNDPGYEPDVPGNPVAEQEWLEHFLAVAPELRGRIRDYRVQTWEHCFALLSPGRAAVIDELRAPVGGIHFAGDWTSEAAGTHGALAESRRVAEEIMTSQVRDTTS